jgi:hypothetical protein
MNLRLSLTALAGFAAIGIAWAAADIVTPPRGATTDIEGLTIESRWARTWKAFDGKVPTFDGAERWVSGEMTIEAVRDPAIAGSALTSGTREMSRGADHYAAAVEGFSGKDAPKATGRFVEVGLWFSNGGTATHTVSLLDATSKTIDARLVLASGTPVPPVAFLIPGVGVAKTSLLRSFDGKLAVTLAPGQLTWAILVFDVPAAQKPGKLQLKNGPTVDVRLP